MNENKKFKDEKKPRPNGGSSRKNRGKNKKFSYPEDMDYSAKAQPNAKCSRKSTNHMEWYSNNPALLRDAASLNFTRPLGATVSVVKQSSFGSVDSNKFYVDGHYTPGIATLRTMLTPGISNDSTSAVNVSARNIYSFVRFKNSGAKNYDATQMMFYILAVDQLHAWHEYLKRLYGVIMEFSQKNKYYPKGITQALGGDYDDLSSHMADFRWLINYTADRASIFYIPDGKNIPLLERHKYMYSSLYYDRDIVDKAQIYAFIPDGYFVWTETTRPFQLSYTRLPNALGSASEVLTLEDLRRITEEIISPLIESEDAQIISGDILKAYGESAMLSWDQMPEDYRVEPIFDVGMLTQIHNLSWTDGAIQTINVPGYEPAAPSTAVILDDVNSNSIIFRPVTPHTWEGMVKDRLLNLPFAEPLPEDVMRATRLMFSTGDPVNPETATPTPSGAPQWIIETAGSEIVTRINIVSWNGSNFRLDQVDNYANLVYDDGGVTVRQFFADYSLILQFDWFPLVGVIANTVGPDGLYTFNWLGERMNWTTVSTNTLRDINHTAIMSEYNIPIL